MLQHGDQLGEFEIRRLLGRGGMGEVYEAFQPSLGRTVALKVLAEGMADGEEALKLFQHEAKFAAGLDHPNIVPIHALAEHASRQFFTMKLVRGVSLGEAIRWAENTTLERGTPPRHPTLGRETTAAINGVGSTAGEGDDEIHDDPTIGVSDLLVDSRAVEELLADRFRFAARVGRDLAQALDYAHQEGHTHRDIKPSNIMIDHHGVVYLIDFGLARAISPTASEFRRGTLRYMSPEQIDMRPLDGRTDIYSLGATLYHLVVGRPPFEGDEESEIARRIRDGATAPLPPETPPALAHCIETAMRPNPDERFRSAAEMAAALDACLSGAHDATVVRGRTGTQRVARRRRQTPARRRQAVLVGGAVALMLVAGLFAALAVSGQRARVDYGFRTDGRPMLPGQRYEVLRAAPIPLSRAPDSTWNLDASRQELTIDSPVGDRTMLAVGGTTEHLPGYTIRTDLTCTPSRWPFIGGVFFGAHEYHHDGAASRRYQVIYLVRRGSSGPNDPQGGYYLDRDVVTDGVIDEGVASQRLPDNFDPQAPHTLELSVDERGLREVILDGQRLDRMTSREVNLLVTGDDYAGDFGFLVRTGQIVLRNATIELAAVE